MFLLPEIALSLVLLLVLYHGAPVVLMRFPAAQVQNVVLLAYSCALFAWFAPVFLVLLVIYTALVCVLFQYADARTMFHKTIVASGLISLSVGVLLAVKYYNPVREFLGAHETVLANLPALNMVLGFSASFLTFQYISLAMLWWHGGLPRTATPLHLGVYIAFFPTLAAGPISRAHLILPQLNAPRGMIAPRYALMRIALGVWQMLVCAQWLAEVWVNPIYAAPQNHHGLEVLAAILAYSLQIYLDFSGLSNIVMGLAWLLGLRLPRNFRSPYASWNIREFWRRWHISLSTWIRDYLYKPLGGSRKGFARAQFAVALSMGLSGAWHGAALTFLVWAGLHIAALITLNSLDALNLRWRLPRWLGGAVTFAWVSTAWVFFRAETLDHAWSIFAALGNTQVLIQYNVLGFAVLLAMFFLAQYLGPRCAQWAMRGVRMAPHWAFFTGLSASIWLAIEMGPSGVPNFIYAGF